MIEVEDNYCYELLAILNRLPIKIIENHNAVNKVISQITTLPKKYTKQDMLNKISYQGTANDSQNIDDLIYEHNFWYQYLGGII